MLQRQIFARPCLFASCDDALFWTGASLGERRPLIVQRGVSGYAGLPDLIAMVPSTKAAATIVAR